MFYSMYCATEDTFAAYLTTFVVKSIHWSKSHGAQVTSLFWASFTVGRFASIFLVRCLSPVKFLLLSCTSMALSLLAFLLFSIYNINPGIWLASALAGASMAPVFPTGFIWMESEFVRVTGRVASSILIASSSGTMANPIILGYLMEEITPIWFSYLLCLEAAMVFLLFLLLLALSRLYIRKHYSMHPVTPDIGMTVPAPDQQNDTSICS
jgi:FHS family Na+ dependent glucose MFS transporter 1